VRRAIAPVAVTLIFMTFAQYATASGLAQQLAWRGVVGDLATMSTPFIGALAGALTASNTASNGLAMPLQIALAQGEGLDSQWTAAIQNVSGSTFTLLAPVRISIGCALAGIVGAEARVYRLALPIGIAALLPLVVAVCFLRLFSSVPT
jgi:lactate permease